MWRHMPGYGPLFFFTLCETKIYDRQNICFCDGTILLGIAKTKLFIVAEEQKGQPTIPLSASSFLLLLAEVLGIPEAHYKCKCGMLYRHQ